VAALPPLALALALKRPARRKWMWCRSGATCQARALPAVLQAAVQRARARQPAPAGPPRLRAVAVAVLSRVQAVSS
jgi:hypothetical protein